MAIYKGVHAKITISGVVIAVANEATIRTSDQPTWETSVGKKTTDVVDGTYAVEWNCTRKLNNDATNGTLFMDLQANRNDFDVKLEMSGVSNTVVVASSCRVENYEYNVGGADDVVTERISGRAIHYYFA